MTTYTMHDGATRYLRDNRSTENKMHLEAMKFKSGAAFPGTTLSGERGHSSCRAHSPLRVKDFLFPLVVLFRKLFSHNHI